MASPKTPTVQVPSRGVQSDGSVHFEIKAPNAKTVTVNIEGRAAEKMEKGTDGVWSYTSAPMAPDYYGYSYSVDGVNILDPECPLIKPNLIWQSNMFLVPGKPPELWEVQDVPHGSVTEHFYKSEVIGDQRNYFVYTPPEYDAKSSKRYPVLYLLHGYSDTAAGWTAVGKAQVILDNLIAQKKIQPMLVVMPLGYGVANFAGPTSGGFSNPERVRQNYERFRSALLTEMMPQVETAYHVSRRRQDRAIAGLSMGGAETLFVGLNNLDKFCYVGAFSTGGLSDHFDENFPGLKGPEVNKALRVMYVACGTEDGLITYNRHLVEWFKSKGTKVEQVETPGQHTWMVWRRDLIEFTQKLFKG